LLEAHEIVEIEVPGGGKRYEIAHLDHHHHFHCRQCNRVFEVHGCPGNLQHLTPNGFISERHEITLTGLCAACAKINA
jgi:Fur family transcriptional regulator, ferric uptake regulator